MNIDSLVSCTNCFSFLSDNVYLFDADDTKLKAAYKTHSRSIYQRFIIYTLSTNLSGNHLILKSMSHDKRYSA